MNQKAKNVMTVMLLLLSGGFTQNSFSAQSRYPGGVCVRLGEGVYVVQPPEEIQKASYPTSGIVRSQEDCEYGSVLSALILSVSAGSIGSCSYFGEAQRRSEYCVSSKLTYIESQKIFYETYFQALQDLKIYMQANDGETPSFQNIHAYPRGVLLAKFPGIGSTLLRDKAPAVTVSAPQETQTAEATTVN